MSEHDCGEDTCVCLDPEDDDEPDDCDECGFDVCDEDCDECFGDDEDEDVREGLDDVDARR